MDKVLGGLPFCFIYLDNVLASTSGEEHLHHLRKVFTRLRENCLSINRDKCTRAADSVIYLGHVIEANGIKPLPKQFDAIKNSSTPTSRKSLSKFVGLLNFYRPFIPNLATTVWPLTKLLSPNTYFSWTEWTTQAFCESKHLLCEAVSLSCFSEPPNTWCTPPLLLRCQRDQLRCRAGKEGEW